MRIFGIGLGGPTGLRTFKSRRFATTNPWHWPNCARPSERVGAIFGATIVTMIPTSPSIRNEPEFKAIFADIERDVAAQRTRLAARPKDAPLVVSAASKVTKLATEKIRVPVVRFRPCTIFPIASHPRRVERSGPSADRRQLSSLLLQLSAYESVRVRCATCSCRHIHTSPLLPPWVTSGSIPPLATTSTSMKRMRFPHHLRTIRAPGCMLNIDHRTSEYRASRPHSATRSRVAGANPAN